MSGGVREARAPRVVLTARWRWLAMLNYRVDPALVVPLAPRGTTVDAWRGETWVSVVGFLFLDTRVLGVPIPFHRSFEEVNLRFYVKREVRGETRHAVTFVRELVRRPAIAAAARLTYNEPYRSVRMRHHVPPGEPPARVEYAWHEPGAWSRVSVTPVGDARPLAPGSHEEFITARHWGYTRQRDGSTVEYRVDHPPWRTWAVRDAVLDGDLALVFGKYHARALDRAADSAWLADGSAVTVHAPLRLPS